MIKLLLCFNQFSREATAGAVDPVYSEIVKDGLLSIGSNVCITQGATLLTGSHNYKKSSFDLLTRGITLEDGAWIGAGAIVNLGVTARSHAVLTAGSVAIRDLEAYGIYQGRPATRIRERIIK